jgi:hypothetical protein
MFWKVSDKSRTAISIFLANVKAIFKPVIKRKIITLPIDSRLFS